MDLWINTREALLGVIRRVDLLTVNEHEARHLTDKGSSLPPIKFWRWGRNMPSSRKANTARF